MRYAAVDWQFVLACVLGFVFVLAGALCDLFGVFV